MQETKPGPSKNRSQAGEAGKGRVCRWPLG